jgi:hypothetical protein
MKGVNFSMWLTRQPLIAAVVLVVCVGAAEARGQQTTVPQSPIAKHPAELELVITGPTTMPVFRKGLGVTFHATLVNRSQTFVTLVRPHREWFDKQLLWSASDAKGRSADHLPVYQMECLPLPECPNVVEKPFLIHDGDVLVLKPGESYDIAGLRDPSFSLKFLHRGAYRIQLLFNFRPQDFQLTPESKNSVLLTKAKELYMPSNTLEITIN